MGSTIQSSNGNSESNMNRIESTFSNGISVTVTLLSGLLNVVAVLPQNFMGLTQGLLGNFNGNNTDDFIYPNGTQLDNDASDRMIHDFGLSCKRIELMFHSNYCLILTLFLLFFFFFQGKLPTIQVFSHTLKDSQLQTFQILLIHRDSSMRFSMMPPMKPELSVATILSVSLMQQRLGIWRLDCRHYKRIKTISTVR